MDKYDLNIINQNENLHDGYYHFLNDLLAYPDAWCYVVWSMRGPGKTYSNLWASYYLNIKNMYIKRTNKDVKFICQSSDDAEYNPFNPICRDKGILVRPKLITETTGGFYHAKANGDTGEIEPDVTPTAYYKKLNCVQAYQFLDSQWFDLLSMGLINRNEVFKIVDYNIMTRRVKRNGIQHKQKTRRN